MSVTMKFAPCLWFDTQAEDAAKYYVSIFKNSKINKITRYPAVGQEIHGKPAGSVMTVEFELDGQTFTALNGGPHFKFNEAVSLQVFCDTQEEIDKYWDTLSRDGDARAQQCGWLKDKYGLSWQIVPKVMDELFSDHESETAKRAMAVMLQMKKLNIAEIERAVKGSPADAGSKAHGTAAG
jgi:predicted 3-demethylubiquinone-9 3-methyltransferase (glyoxalase superfamily)